MIWFRQNRWLGVFASVVALATIASLWFLWSARGDWAEASERWQRDAAELDRLQRLAPFPSGENLRKMKAHAADYTTAVAKLKEELQTRVLPATPLAPNEFQARLRGAVTSVAEKARAARTKLPENFFLGFDEFASALPDTGAAPLLGQQVAQVEMLLNLVLDARVDAITALRRSRLTEETAANATATPPKKPAAAAAGPKLVERSVVDFTFASTPAAARRVLNSIAAADHQLFVVRVLQVVNEKDKGPARDAPTDAAASAAAGAKGPTAGLKFIVGEEHIQTSAKIEIARFTF